MEKVISGKNLGEFEMLVLAALIHLGNKAYGVNIRREIESRTGRAVSIGAVYTTLARMEKKSYVDSMLGESTKKRGGKAKRYFTVSQDGKMQFKRSLDSLHKMTEGIGKWLDA